MSSENCRNIEIKAQLADERDFNAKLQIAKDLVGENHAEILIQRDVFFNCTKGRLKLRYENGNSPKLIQYDRDNIQGPKLSKFNILDVQDGKLLEKILGESIGFLGILEKTRHLCMCDRTRIHLDTVKNNDQIFYGMEFEVKLTEHESVETGNKIAEELLEKFNINRKQLLEGSYFEILNSLNVT